MSLLFYIGKRCDTFHIVSGKDTVFDGIVQGDAQNFVRYTKILYLCRPNDAYCYATPITYIHLSYHPAFRIIRVGCLLRQCMDESF